MKKILFSLSALGIIAICAFFILSSPLTVNAQSGPPSDMGSYGPPSSGSMGPPADVEAKKQKALERLKRGAASMEKGVNQFEKVVKVVQAAGYTVQPDILSAITSVRSAIATIRAATDFDDTVQDAIDTSANFFEVLDANMENFAMLSQFPRILKGAGKAMTTLKTNFEKAKSLLLAGVDFDVTEILAAVQTKVDALQALYDKANAAANSGNAQDAFAILQDEFFPSIEDASQSVGMLNAIRGLNRASIAMTRGFQSAQKIVDRLKKLKKDTSGLEAILTNMKTKLESFKAILKTPGYDPENAVVILDEIDVLRTQFEDTLDGIISESDEATFGKIAPVKLFSGKAPSTPLQIQQGYDRAATQGTKALGVDTDSFDMSGYDMSGGTDNYQIPEGYGPSGF